MNLLKYLDRNFILAFKRCEYQSNIMFINNIRIRILYFYNCYYEGILIFFLFSMFLFFFYFFKKHFLIIFWKFEQTPASSIPSRATICCMSFFSLCCFLSLSLLSVFWRNKNVQEDMCRINCFPNINSFYRDV